MYAIRSYYGRPEKVIVVFVREQLHDAEMHAIDIPIPGAHEKRGVGSRRCLNSERQLLRQDAGAQGPAVRGAARRGESGALAFANT